MSKAFEPAKGTTELVAAEDLFLTADFATKGDKTIVRGNDARAAILLARKGTSIPERLAIQLGGEAGTLKIADLSPPTVSTEDIAARKTRPEKPESHR